MRDELFDKLALLTNRQLNHVERLIDALAHGADTWYASDSDFADAKFTSAFGDLLIAHNQGSGIPMTKDKFEYAMVDALRESGHSASKLPNGNPGEDIVVDEVPWSLKTQADRNIKLNQIHISKFMELGKGHWETINDISLLRQRMFSHMTHYDRIFTLRCFPRESTDEGGTKYSYELVEIPKSLLYMSKDAGIVIRTDSRQNPKPAYAHVLDHDGNEIFSLYFDGGTERKLQVKKLNKDYCKVHATWSFVVEKR